MKIRRTRRNVKASAKSHKKPIMAGAGGASADTYEAYCERISYLLKKILADMKSAAKILDSANTDFQGIVPSDQYYNENATDFDYSSFWDWYMEDEGKVSNGAEVVESTTGWDRNYYAYGVEYGDLSSDELYNEVHDYRAADFYQVLQNFCVGSSYMEDLYYSTVEYEHTLDELANNPDAVFSDIYDSEKEKYELAYEVVLELDLWTQGDSAKAYSYTESAKGLVQAYEELGDYFSSDTMQDAFDEYISYQE